MNYQRIRPAGRGERDGMGDTGVVIYGNSVFGARSNFEGGPSALAAGLTGRTPRYGYHLDECRHPTRRLRLAAPPRHLSEWGELGRSVGDTYRPYSGLPMIEGIYHVLRSHSLHQVGAP